MVYHYSDCAGGPQYGGHEVLETSVLSRPKRSVERTKVVRYTMGLSCSQYLEFLHSV